MYHSYLHLYIMIYPVHIWTLLMLMTLLRCWINFILAIICPRLPIERWLILSGHVYRWNRAFSRGQMPWLKSFKNANYKYPKINKGKNVLQLFVASHWTCFPSLDYELCTVVYQALRQELWLSANIEIGFHMSERAGTCRWLLRSTHVVIRPSEHIQRD